MQSTNFIKHSYIKRLVCKNLLTDEGKPFWRYAGIYASFNIVFKSVVCEVLNASLLNIAVTSKDPSGMICVSDRDILKHTRATPRLYHILAPVVENYIDMDYEVLYGLSSIDLYALVDETLGKCIKLNRECASLLCMIVNHVQNTMIFHIKNLMRFTNRTCVNHSVMEYAVKSVFFMHPDLCNKILLQLSSAADERLELSDALDEQPELPTATNEHVVPDAAL